VMRHDTLTEWAVEVQELIEIRPYRVDYGTLTCARLLVKI